MRHYGFVGAHGSVSVLVDGLRKLEYRGYDSADIACQNGKGIELFKTIRKDQGPAADPSQADA